MDEADLTPVALLAEPTRRHLYLYMRERQAPVSREEAARDIGIKPRLAAFHMDRMADEGLLDVQYRRLSGRTGPGAGRPAKVYSLSSRSFSVEVPQTQYSLAASMMATALASQGAAIVNAGREGGSVLEQFAKHARAVVRACG